ncbi:MAG: zf-HC2 domain-containing protein [Candidatus Krumholzibacteriota bacterium]|nr:zf-HC2 domain-containing protein [Candidatus Krumholzibacteriota bacterium]
MRCRTAQEYYLASRDNMLDEMEKIKLQHHIEECPECAQYCREMDDCLSILDSVPEMELPESFDWNVKRMIALEKSRVMRERAGSVFTNPAWGRKFVTSAAAVLLIVLAGAWLVIGDGSSDSSGTDQAARINEKTVSPARGGRNINYTSTGYPAGIRMVSDDFYGNSGGDSYRKQQPFSMESERRIEYLAKENKMLREYIEYYKTENIKLKRIIVEQNNDR